MITTCTACLDIKEVKPFDLYIVGSEGCQLCFECQMDVVNYIRAMRLLAGRALKMGYQMASRKGEGEA